MTEENNTIEENKEDLDKENKDNKKSVILNKKQNIN